MKKAKSPQRLMRLVEKTLAAYISKHPVLWGQSKEDVFNKALTAVWKSGAKTPEEAKRAIVKSLWQSRDESKHSRRCLVPSHVRKAEAKALADARGVCADAARQAAYREFLEDYALLSKRTAINEIDRLRVRRTIAMLSPEDREIAIRFMRLGSIKGVAISFGVAPRTYLRREWAAFRERFIAAWKTIS